MFLPDHLGNFPHCGTGSIFLRRLILGDEDAIVPHEATQISRELNAATTSDCGDYWNAEVDNREGLSTADEKGESSVRQS